MGGEQGIGFRHLAFEASRLEPVIESLRADGIESDPIIDISHHIPGCRVAFCRDPEGNLIEFVEAQASSSASS